MKFEKLGITNSLLWFLISVFLFVWLGSQLFGAITNLEIQNLRVTDIVSFSSRPIWFSTIVSLKALVWFFSLVVMYKYAKSSFSR
jgi:NhaP-type Na+/H+ or K+/H+ antiporter